MALKGSQSPRIAVSYYIPPERHGVVLEMHPLVLVFASMDSRLVALQKDQKSFEEYLVWSAR